MAKRSTIPLNGFLSLVLLWLFSLAIARRCDRSVPVDSWTRCMECSLNRFQRCPRGYRILTGGDGIQRCSYLINFGANFGHIAVIGCQHLCTRTIIRRECCVGFWGRDCQGRKCSFFVFCFCFFSFSPFFREKKGFCITNFIILELPNECFQLLLPSFYVASINTNN